MLLQGVTASCMSERDRLGMMSRVMLGLLLRSIVLVRFLSCPQTSREIRKAQLTGTCASTGQRRTAECISCSRGGGEVRSTAIVAC